MADDRRSPRRVANAVRSFQIEPNNDAVVLNFSDWGLGFRARRPLSQPGTIRFSFSENGQQIDASGELVWTDLTTKTGGLSFASLPRADRERIRNWVDQAGTPKSTGPASEPAFAPSKDSPVSGASLPHANPEPT